MLLLEAGLDDGSALDAVGRLIAVALPGFRAGLPASGERVDGGRALVKNRLDGATDGSCYCLLCALREQRTGVCGGGWLAGNAGGRRGGTLEFDDAVEQVSVACA
jgi:hypothetical protein